MKKPPTARQSEAYDIVEDEIRRTGRAPVLRVIGRKMQISIAAVAFKLNALEKRGLIRRDPGVPRGIELVQAAHSERLAAQDGEMKKAAQ